MNVSAVDIERTVAELPGFCRPDATVIWTRHRKSPDLTPRIREWFAAAGFAELAFDIEDGYLFGGGTHQYTGRPTPFRPDIQLFTFTGNGADANR